MLLVHSRLYLWRISFDHKSFEKAKRKNEEKNIFYSFNGCFRAVELRSGEVVRRGRLHRRHRRLRWEIIMIMVMLFPSLHA